MNEIIDQIKPKMQKAIDSLAHEFNKIRTGRANPSILDSVKIDYYGTEQFLDVYHQIVRVHTVVPLEGRSVQF